MCNLTCRASRCRASPKQRHCVRKSSKIKTTSQGKPIRWASNDKIFISDIFSWTNVIPFISRHYGGSYITLLNCLQWGLYTEVFQVERNLKWPLERLSWGRTSIVLTHRGARPLSLSQTPISTWLSIIRHYRELLRSLRESFLFLWCAYNRFQHELSCTAGYKTTAVWNCFVTYVLL